jgi:putative hydrolase of the HAD superfamily
VSNHTPATGTRIEAILFDFGGVLTVSAGSTLGPWADASGADPAELEAVLHTGYGDSESRCPWNLLEQGEISLAEAQAWLTEEGSRRGWHVDLGALTSLMQDIPIRTGMVEAVRALRAAGYRTAIVSNTVREWGPMWEKLPCEELFDAVIASCDIGLRKPQPAYFQHALDRLGGVAPDAAVLLDDTELVLAGARAIGLKTIRVADDYDTALEALEQLLQLHPGALRWVDQEKGE